jgi:hypothetical protein
MTRVRAQAFVTEKYLAEKIDFKKIVGEAPLAAGWFYDWDELLLLGVILVLSLLPALAVKKLAARSVSA